MIDKGLMGLRTGHGYYGYPDPSYAAADFLDVPDMAQAAAEQTEIIEVPIGPPIGSGCLNDPLQLNSSTNFMAYIL